MVVKDYSMQARDNNSSTGNSCVDNNRDNDLHITSYNNKIGGNTINYNG